MGKKIKCKECLNRSASLKNLTKEQLLILENNSVQILFKKGENIFKQDALSTNVAFLREGITKLHMQGPSREKILKIVKGPIYLGIPTAFSDKINQYSATAISSCSVCFIDSNTFRNFIYTNGKYAYEIIVELCKNELSDYNRFANQTQKQTNGLVAETLLCMSDHIFKSDTFDFPLTRSEIGDLIGTSRENVSRILTDFKKENIIELNGTEISILNKNLLEKISNKG